VLTDDVHCGCLRVAAVGSRGANGTGDALVDWISPATAQGVAELGSAVLTPELLAPYQVIVVQDVRVGSGDGGSPGLGRHFSISERDALIRWVADGGGLLTLTGYEPSSSEVENVNLLLAPFGLSYAAMVIFPTGAWVSTWASHPLKGRVFAWGDEAVTYGDAYGTSDGTRFWLNVFAWLAQQNECQVALPP